MSRLRRLKINGLDKSFIFTSILLALTITLFVFLASKPTHLGHNGSRQNRQFYIVTSYIVDRLTAPHDWRNSQLRCWIYEDKR